MFLIRRIYFIKKDFQLRFILSFVAIVTIWAASTVIIYTYLAEKRLDSVRYSSHIDIATMNGLLLPVTLGTHTVSFLVFALILYFAINRIWKKLSPTLHTLKKEIMRISTGDLTSEISLTKYEEFQDLALELDHMRLELKNKIQNIKQQQQIVATAAAGIDKTIHGGGEPTAHAVTLQTALDRIKAEIEQFQ